MTMQNEESQAQATDFSFADAVEALLPELRAFAYTLCRDRDLADDIVQDTCLKAWAAIDSFDPSLPLRPWVFRILRNTYFAYGRRSWRQVGAEPEILENTLIAPTSFDSIADLKRMADIIYRLPAAQRDAFILVVAGGYTYDEAGEVCDCPPGTIKSRVNRARQAILDQFDANEHAPLQPGSETPAIDRFSEHIADLDTPKAA